MQVLLQNPNTGELRQILGRFAARGRRFLVPVLVPALLLAALTGKGDAVCADPQGYTMTCAPDTTGGYSPLYWYYQWNGRNWLFVNAYGVTNGRAYWQKIYRYSSPYYCYTYEVINGQLGRYLGVYPCMGH
jgi:hypothetical protein